MKKILFILILSTLTSCKEDKLYAVSGNVFYNSELFYYNKMPDSGSDVILIPLFKCDTVYRTSTDMDGNFTINTILTGNYLLIVKSENVTSNPWEEVSKISNYNYYLSQKYPINKEYYCREYKRISNMNSKSLDILIGIRTIRDEDDITYIKKMNNKLLDYHKLRDSVNILSSKLLETLPSEMKSDLDIRPYGNKLFVSKVYVGCIGTNYNVINFGEKKY